MGSKNQRTKYWEKLKNFNPKFNFSDEFKDLICKFFKYNPKKRITINEIRQHDWFKGNLLT